MHQNQPEEGHILIRSELSDAAVILHVCDQSGGIPEAERNRVFEPFFQGARQPIAPSKAAAGVSRSCAKRCWPLVGRSRSSIVRLVNLLLYNWPLPQ